MMRPGRKATLSEDEVISAAHPGGGLNQGICETRRRVCRAEGDRSVDLKDRMERKLERQG